jgi:hypothetical protein
MRLAAASAVTLPGSSITTTSARQRRPAEGRRIPAIRAIGGSTYIAPPAATQKAAGRGPRRAAGRTTIEAPR